MTEHAELTSPANEREAQKLSRLRLDSLPLPAIRDDSDKEDRGVVLAIGGSQQVPGAIMLSGVAALRAGAGKLQIGTVRNAALALGLMVPESLVIGLPFTRHGEIDAAAASQLLRQKVHMADSVLIGPGMINKANAADLARQIVPLLSPGKTLILDGAAILALSADENLLHACEENAIITPHAGEMAALLEIPIDEIRANAGAVAQNCADRFRAIVVMKGGETWIAHPNTSMLHYSDGNAGLGTSGSGDVLAGVVAGLAARGAAPMTAAAWAVWVHGSAGNKLSRSVGKIGFLASELLAEIPKVLNDQSLI